MRERIEKKIDEIVETIIAKDPANISYMEYRVLETRLSVMKYGADREAMDKED